MGKSPHFARIKRDVLRLVGEIPRGRVTTYGSIGAELDVMARHVAYILAMLTPQEAEGLPWHRVVGDQGLVKSTRKRTSSDQRALLAAEGVTVNDQGLVRDFDQLHHNFS